MLYTKFQTKNAHCILLHNQIAVYHIIIIVPGQQLIVRIVNTKWHNACIFLK